MENHFKSPQSDIGSEEEDAKSGWNPSLSIGLTFVSGILYFMIYIIVPQFKEIFDAFGSELPSFTLFVMDTYRFYSIFILIGVIPCILLFINQSMHRKKQRKLFTVVVFNLVLSFLILCFVLAGLYWPIFQLGSVI